VLATQNPVEQEGVYRLPEAQLDRFLLRVQMGYPGADREVDMLKLLSAASHEPEQLYNTESILEIQAQLNQVHASDTLLRYIVELAETSRRHADLLLGASPRASYVLMRCARARALLDGRHYCTHEDVQAIALPVLSHRLIIRPEAEVEGKTVDDVVRELLASVPVLENRDGLPR
jgi:MoxR-like ATPase